MPAAKKKGATRNSRTRKSSKGMLYDDEVIGGRIEKLRLARGLKQEELADETGMKKSEISRKIRAKTPTWMAEFSAIHAALKGWPLFPFSDEQTGKLLKALDDGHMAELFEFVSLPIATRRALLAAARGLRAGPDQEPESNQP